MMGHYTMVKQDRKFTPRRKDDVYAKIINLLDSPMSSQQIATRIDLCNGSIFAVLNRMLEVGAVSREKIGKSYIYTRRMQHITKEEMYRMKPAVIVKKPTVAGARLIDFSTKQMQQKLHDLDKIYLQDSKRKAGKVYVSGQTLEMIG